MTILLNPVRSNGQMTGIQDIIDAERWGESIMAEGGHVAVWFSGNVPLVLGVPGGGWIEIGQDFTFLPSEGKTFQSMIEDRLAAIGVGIQWPV
jgi:hypothetical protein